MDEKKINMLIQKSRPLLELIKGDLTLEELKLLDIYLAHVNSRDPETRTVSFSQGEMEEILGVTQIRPEDLRARLHHLLKNTIITLGDTNLSKEVKQIAFFSMAESKKERSGRWHVHLRCSDDALCYVFDIENLGYIKYRIKRYQNIHVS